MEILIFGLILIFATVLNIRGPIVPYIANGELTNACSCANETYICKHVCSIRYAIATSSIVILDNII